MSSRHYKFILIKYNFVRQINHIFLVFISVAYTEIQLLAYPYGRSNSKVHSIAKSVGYLAAFGLDKGSSQTYNRWRVCMTTDDDLKHLWYKLSIYYRTLKALKDQMFVGSILRKVKDKFL